MLQRARKSLCGLAKLLDLCWIVVNLYEVIADCWVVAHTEQVDNVGFVEVT